MNSRWAVVASTQPDEIISSWMVRTALMQGCDPMTLTFAVWPRWRIWTHDADRFANEDRLDRICVLSGIEKGTLRAASLFPIAKQIYGRTPPEKATWSWIVAPGARNTKRHSGIQYCPACLKNDVRPYFRIHWRFAWHTCCKVHGHALLDRCHACNSPVEYHRLEAEDELITVCATCKADLRTASSRGCVSDALKFQLVADDVLLNGIGTFQSSAMSISPWFELADYFVSLIRVAQRGENQTLSEFLKLIGVQLPMSPPMQPGNHLETLQTHDRERLLAALLPIMSVSKDKFDGGASKNQTFQNKVLQVTG
ncbi:TniQ family protein [Rhodoferax lithotrophicus]|nr:TniQ family protein [Rhodoferax sp. MIZ03]